MTKLSKYICHDILTGENLSVEVEKGIIVRRNRIDTKLKNLPIIIPSLIDLQVNGFKGNDINDRYLEPETVESLSNSLCEVGIRKYLPTIVTASESDICQKLTAIRKASKIFPRSKEMIAGVHIEGPAISNKNGPRGAHPKEYIRPATISEFKRWQLASENLIKLITIAPETEGAEQFIEYVTNRKILVSIGHTDAKEADIDKAVTAGASMSTHLGNGVSNCLPRHPNLIWAQLAEDKLMASFIADRHHLSKSALKSMLRAKGVEFSILVSDSVKFAGLPSGRYHSFIGGEVDVSDDGRISIVDTPYLAGSGTSLLNIVCGFSEFTDLPFKNAVAMSCINPARLLGVDNSLKVGSPAHFILLNADKNCSKLSVADIIFQGRSVLK